MDIYYKKKNWKFVIPINSSKWIKKLKTKSRNKKIKWKFQISMVILNNKTDAKKHKNVVQIWKSNTHKKLI